MITVETNNILSLPERVIRLETVIENINQSLIRIERKVDKLEERFEKNDEKFKKIDEKLDSLSHDVSKIRSDIRWIIAVGSSIAVFLCAQVIKLIFN